MLLKTFLSIVNRCFKGEVQRLRNSFASKINVSAPRQIELSALRTFPKIFIFIKGMSTFEDVPILVCMYSLLSKWTDIDAC